MRRKGAALFIVGCSLLACGTPSPARAIVPAREDLAAALRIRDAARTTSRAWETIRSLTDEVGPRLAGSPGDSAAVAWGLRTLTAYGFANVHSEAATVPHWERGEESGQITAPFTHRVALAAIGGSISTADSGIESEVIEAESLEALDRLPPASVAGKIVFLYRPTARERDGSGYGATVGLRYAGASHAARLGAIGLIIRSIGSDTDRLPHTGALHYDDPAHPIPAAALSVPDAELMHRLIASHQRVRFQMRLGARTLPDAQSANVVGEIPGTDRRDEIVLLAAHLDSWDLGTGALDDGAGCAIIIEAARLIAAQPGPLHRTVRVVLFANEENGTRGARAYAAAHQTELPRHVLAMEADAGDGHVWSMRIPARLQGQAAYVRLEQLLMRLDVKMASGDAHGGADIGPLRPAGVPAIDLRQDMTRYFDVHHTANDVLEQVQRDELDRAVGVYAATAYTAAQMNADFGRAVASDEH